MRDYFLITGHETFSLQSSRDEVGNVQTALQLHSELDREQAAAYTVRLCVCTRVRPMNMCVVWEVYGGSSHGIPLTRVGCFYSVSCT